MSIPVCMLRRGRRDLISACTLHVPLSLCSTTAKPPSPTQPSAATFTPTTPTKPATATATAAYGIMYVCACVGRGCCVGGLPASTALCVALAASAQLLIGMHACIRVGRQALMAGAVRSCCTAKHAFRR